MKNIIIFTTWICGIFLLVSCEKQYVTNFYQIKDVELEFIDFVGIDSNRCAIHEEFVFRKENQYSGIVIKIKKLFLSDSTIVKPFFGAYFPIGKRGALDTIKRFSFNINNQEVNSHFEGDWTKDYISSSGIYTQHRCADPPECNCMWAPTFRNFSEFVHAYNTNDEYVLGDQLDGDKIYFWIEKKKLRQFLRPENENKMLLRLETSQDVFANPISF